MQKFKTVDELVSQLQPVKPVYCIRKQSVKRAASFFIKKTLDMMSCGPR